MHWVFDQLSYSMTKKLYHRTAAPTLRRRILTLQHLRSTSQVFGRFQQLSLFPLIHYEHSGQTRWKNFWQQFQSVTLVERLWGRTQVRRCVTQWWARPWLTSARCCVYNHAFSSSFTFTPGAAEHNIWTLRLGLWQCGKVKYCKQFIVIKHYSGHSPK